MKDLFFILFSIYIILYIWSTIACVKIYIKDKFDEYLEIHGEVCREDLYTLLDKDDLICLFIYIPILCTVSIPFVYIKEINEIIDCVIDKKDYL